MKLTIIIKILIIIQFITICLSVNVDKNFNYCNALKSSLNYFNGARAGNLTGTDLELLYPWQYGVTSNLDTTTDKALNKNGNGLLSSGYFNDGSYIKSTFSIAHSMTSLGWSYLEFQHNINSCPGLKQQYLSTLRVGIDWLMAAHTSEKTIYAQCGKVGEYKFWNIPSRIYDLWNGSPKRTCWLVIDETKPGSDVAHEMVAAFSASHMIFSLIDPEYAMKLRTHAFQLYSFGVQYPGKFSDIPTSGEPMIHESSGYMDEFFWSTAWMYQITGDNQYYNLLNSVTFTSALSNFNSISSVSYNYDQKMAAAVVLLAKKFGMFTKQSNEILKYWSTNVPKTKSGLLFTGGMGGSIKHSMGGSLLEAIWNNNQHPSRAFKDTFHIDQMKIILGNNSADRSYMCNVGFLGSSSPVNLHHRASHYSLNNTILFPLVNSYPLDGALVGGPIDLQDYYMDDRLNLTMNQPSIDSNAVLTGVIASMILNETVPEQPDTPTTGPYTTTGTPPPNYTSGTYTTGYGSSSTTTGTTTSSGSGSSSTTSKPSTGYSTGYQTGTTTSYSSTSTGYQTDTGGSGSSSSTTSKPTTGYQTSTTTSYPSQTTSSTSSSTSSTTSQTSSTSTTGYPTPSLTTSSVDTTTTTTTTTTTSSSSSSSEMSRDSSEETISSDPSEFSGEESSSDTSNSDGDSSSNNNSNFSLEDSSSSNSQPIDSESSNSDSVINNGSYTVGSTGESSSIEEIPTFTPVTLKPTESPTNNNTETSPNESSDSINASAKDSSRYNLLWPLTLIIILIIV